MYEVRQNKDKVSRIFSCLKINKDSKVSSITNHLNLQRVAIASKNGETIQRVKTIVIEMLPFISTHLTTDAQNVNIRKHFTSLGHGNNHYNYSHENIIHGSMLATPKPKSISTDFTSVDTIEKDETLILVSHGARYVPIFAFRTPGMLARDIFNSKILPLGYRGQIYLDGCYTGEPSFLGSLKDGTSFAEKFKFELNRLSNAGVPMYGDFKVKGNLGAAMTLFNGTELIRADARSKELMLNNVVRLLNEGQPVVTNPKHKHVYNVSRKNKIGPFTFRNRTVTYLSGKYTKIIF